MNTSQSPNPKPSHTEIAEAFPEAVATARAYREVFGPGVKLLYARNQAGQTIGKQSGQIETGQQGT